MDPADARARERERDTTSFRTLDICEVRMASRRILEQRSAAQSSAAQQSPKEIPITYCGTWKPECKYRSVSVSVFRKWRLYHFENLKHAPFERLIDSRKPLQPQRHLQNSRGKPRDTKSALLCVLGQSSTTRRCVALRCVESIRIFFEKKVARICPQTKEKKNRISSSFRENHVSETS